MDKIFFVIFVFLKKYREQMVFLCSKYWETKRHIYLCFHKGVDYILRIF